MDLRLGGTVVLVTGAGPRLARAIGLGFAREGALVAFHHHASADGARAAAARRKPVHDVTPMIRRPASPPSGWTTGRVVSVDGGYAMV